MLLAVTIINVLSLNVLGDAMAQASSTPHNPSPQSTAVSPPTTTGEIAAAGSLGATDKQTEGSLAITHANGKRKHSSTLLIQCKLQYIPLI